ncbi:sulfite exporter TauE/SafE family protein [Pseudorhodobacter turbinis]|uniref:Probable membrane transporter protein n=1 Tax=Pseudorhodobacter turbinis TaxID=2500533 RepID=A0A4P8EHX6_9RHOB|nr:sulfite exporter TauE/SafE family protein [Pseudorhodobacter turbinis]QCO56576.1 sulfite exporter TauE/SafE family protein [Pseudorhodobacter turbinis]
MEGFGFWAAAVLASVAVGLSKGGLPVIAMMSVPILSLAMPPMQAAGLLLPIYIVSDWFGVWAYRRAYDLSVLKIMIPATAIGVGIGWATASLVSEAMVGGVIGLVGSSFAISRLLGRGAHSEAKRPKVLPGVFWGAAAGFTSFVSHAGGPPYQIYAVPLRMPKAVFAGTSTLLFTWVNTVKLPAYWSIGILQFDNLAIAVWLIAPATLAVFAGVRLVRILPEKLFYTLVLWALLLLSLRMLWVAVA